MRTHIRQLHFVAAAPAGCGIFVSLASYAGWLDLWGTKNLMRKHRTCDNSSAWVAVKLYDMSTRTLGIRFVISTVLVALSLKWAAHTLHDTTIKEI
jgi:hypothetical protein